MPGRVRTFDAQVVLDGTTWEATVDEPDLAVRARSLESARVAVVDALADHFGVHPTIVAVREDVRIGEAGDRVREALEARDAALAAQERSKRTLERAATALRDAGVSMRDSAYLLGLSHSRVQQVLAEADGGSVPTRKDKGK